MSEYEYKKQRAKTIAADKAHEEFMLWYSAKLEVTRNDLKKALNSLSPCKAAEFYKQWLEK